MVDALDLAQAERDDRRPALSRATVEQSFTIQAMARSLAEVYSDVSSSQSGLRERVVPAS
jgi:hypothetical protein